MEEIIETIQIGLYYLSILALVIGLVTVFMGVVIGLFQKPGNSGDRIRRKGCLISIVGFVVFAIIFIYKL